MARQPKTKSANSQDERDNAVLGPDFPDEWVSIAAYYIWKRDGEHEGRDTDYWERAKIELTTMRQEGVLPVEWEKGGEQ
jgi:hypothetical protein